MDCIQCKVTNPDGNRYCGQCGAELGRTLDETVRKKGFRDRQATEMEITESVAKRLVEWGKLLAAIGAIILLLFGLLLGKSYWDVRTAVEEGKTRIETSVEGAKTEIENSVQQAKNDIGKIRQTTASLEDEVKQLQADINRYKKVNIEIDKLQKEVKEVKGIVDLGERTLRAKAVESTGAGPGTLRFGLIGCPSALEKDEKVAYCAQGSPLSLYQRTATGDLRPVSSLSHIGFQDASQDPKPPCNAVNRGTFYVEKGSVKVADKPFLCVKAWARVKS